MMFVMSLSNDVTATQKTNPINPEVISQPSIICASTKDGHETKPVPKPEPKPETETFMANTVSTTVVDEECDVQSIISETANSNGCTINEIDTLLEIARCESIFNILAVSPNGECVGLFQLDSNKGTYAQRLDPYWNTVKAIEYMNVRYGSIGAAYDFRKSHNWY